MLGQDVLDAVFADYRTAPVGEKVRAALGFIEKMTRHPDALGPDDVAAVYAAGVSEAALNDAAYVCAVFNVYVRLADTLGWDVPPVEGFRIAAKVLLRFGYNPI